MNSSETSFLCDKTNNNNQDISYLLKTFRRLLLTNSMVTPSLILKICISKTNLIVIIREYKQDP